MNKYRIEYRSIADEFAEIHAFYIEASNVDGAVDFFRTLVTKREAEIVEVSRVIKKDFTKM